MRVTFLTDIYEGDFCEIVQIWCNAYYTEDDGFIVDEIAWNDEDFSPEVNATIQRLIPEFDYDIRHMAHIKAYGDLPYFLESKFKNQ